jgi:tetratricopeptide (TPR) repeat protein
MRVALVRVAPQLGDVEWASALARRLASPLSPTASRVEGLLNVALLEASRGRWQSAERAWREADGLAAGLALAHRAWAYASPHAPITHDTLIELRRRLERWTIGTQRLDPAFEPDEQESARLYLSGMLALRAGDAAGTMQMRRRLLAIGSDSATRRMSAALAAGLLGHAALARGQPDVALAALQEAELHWPFARRGGSPVAEQLLERHARAEALLALGRHEEAERWYASLHDGYHLLGSPFLGASLMRRGEILEREGLRGEARETYERLLTLWKDADPEFAERRRVVEGRVVALQR